MNYLSEWEAAATDERISGMVTHLNLYGELLSNDADCLLDRLAELQAEVERLREALEGVMVHDTDGAPADICFEDIMNIVERALNPARQTVTPRLGVTPSE